MMKQTELQIGETIRQLRRERNMTQETLAAHLGILWNIADSYDRYGDRERARMYAEKLPNLYKTRESALIRLTEDAEEKRRLSEEALERIQYLLSQFLPAVFGDEAEETLQKIKALL